MTASFATLRRALLQDEVDALPGWTPGVGHLDQCQSADRRERTCPTCEMHVLTPAVTDLLAMLDDIDALADAPTSLATAVAVAELRRSFDHLATDGHEAVGVRAARERIADLTDARLRSLVHAVESSFADEGPLADDLQRAACLLAVPRLLAGAAHREVTGRILDELANLDRLTDARRVASVAVAHADRVARRGLPPLTIQPEWQMIRATPPQCEPTSRDTLEALVAESIADEVLERAMEIADSHTSIPGRRVVRRPAPAVAMSSPARSLVWRRATINWPLSVADTGLVTCWRPVLTADHLRLSVPLGSAIGLASDAADGRMVSALHTPA
jgi:hypothetical protein